MQLIKWIILFLFLAGFMPSDCQATCQKKAVAPQIQSSTQVINSPKNDLLDLFISFLRINTGDLSEANLHNNYDKKSYLRLFIYSGYSKTHPLLYSRKILTPGMFLSTGPDRVSYYVYALQKIII